MLVNVELKLTKKVKLTVYSTIEQALMAGTKFRMRKLNKGDRDVFYVSLPEAKDIPKDAVPGDVLLGTINYVKEENDDAKKLEGDPFEITIPLVSATPPKKEDVGLHIRDEKVEKEKEKEKEKQEKEKQVVDQEKKEKDEEKELQSSYEEYMYEAEKKYVLSLIKEKKNVKGIALILNQLENKAANMKKYQDGTSKDYRLLKLKLDYYSLIVEKDKEKTKELLTFVEELIGKHVQKEKLLSYYGSKNSSNDLKKTE